MIKRFARTELGKFTLLAGFITALCQIAALPLPGS